MPAATYAYVLDVNAANLAFSGEDLFPRAYLRAGSADYRVASFNTGSGAWLTQRLTGPSLGATAVSLIMYTHIPSGSDFEVHNLLSPSDKDRAIDLSISRTRFRREVVIQGIADARFYNLAALAPGVEIHDIIDAYYWAEPYGSLTRSLARLSDWNVVTSQTGPELRLEPALTISQQIVLDAVISVTLASGDEATTNIDLETVLWGAAAVSYEMLEQGAPGQESQLYKSRKKDANRVFNLRQNQLRASISRRVGLDEAF